MPAVFADGGKRLSIVFLAAPVNGVSVAMWMVGRVGGFEAKMVHLKLS